MNGDGQAQIFLKGGLTRPPMLFEGYTNMQENGMGSDNEDVLKSD